MNWALVPQQIVTGILNGGIIALIALGVVLIFKSSEVFNFAQGHLLMLGAYITWWLAGANQDGTVPFNLPLVPALLIALVVAVVVGFLIERFALRPMSGQPLLSIILMTLGLALLLEGIISILFGTQPSAYFPAPFPPSDVFTIPFPGAFNDQIILKKTLVVASGAALFSAVAFGLFFNYTKTGLSMRAAAEDHELARSMGLDVPRIFGLSWAIAGVIAAIGGVLLAMLVGANLNLSTVVLIAFPAILLGGLDSFPGAIIGGLAVGLAQELVKASTYIEVRNSAEIAPYVLLLIVLLIRPEGVLGQKRIERI
jgi:branched-chain amino acid transport system permease protein